MDLHAYIASGMLELYAARALSPEEEQEVEALLARHPELQQELARIEAAVEAFAQAQAVTPSAGLKDKVMNGLPKTRSLTPEVTQKRSFPMALAAAVALLVVSGGLNLWLAGEWKGVSHERDQLAAKQSELAQSQQIERTSYQEQLGLLADGQTHRTVLAPANASVDGQVTVFWETKGGKTLVRIDRLPPPPAGKQYQLWALAAGKPVDAGVLDYATGTLQPGRKTIFAADAFAITLEPEGGRPEPTLEALMVLGKVVG